MWNETAIETVRFLAWVSLSVLCANVWVLAVVCAARAGWLR